MNKLRKLRGGKSHGRGERKHKGGSKGGVGNAGSFTHHICKKKIVKIKKSKYTKFSDLIYKIDKFIAQGVIIKDTEKEDTFIVLLNKLDKLIQFDKKIYQQFGKTFVFKGLNSNISKSFRNEFEIL